MNSDAPIVLTGRAEYTATLAHAVPIARLEILLVSVDLDRRTYGDAAFLDALTTFLLAHRRARLRGLIHEPRRVMGQGHRFIELARQLSSRIELRELAEPHRKQREEYLLCDERALLHRKAPDALEAEWQPDAPLLARETKRRFVAAWEESLPARELSELKL